MDKKRIALIAAFVAAVFIIGFLLYRFLWMPLLSPGTDTPPTNVNGVLPPLVNGNVSVLPNTNQTPVIPGFEFGTVDLGTPSDVARGGLTNVKPYDTTSVSGMTTGAVGTIFYNREAGYFYKIEDGQLVRLSDQRFFNAEEVTLTSAQDKAILEYPDGSNVLYDFTTERQVTLPKEMNDFSFSSSGDQIAAKWIGSNRDENWLMIGDGQGQDFRLVEPMGDRINNVQVTVSPDSQVIALYRKADGAATQTILPIGQQNENFKAFNVDGMNFTGKWAPAGGSLLYSVADPSDDLLPRLWITGGSGDTVGSSHLDLQLNTWPDRCAFSATGTQVFCAEPIDPPRGSGLYPEVAEGLPHAFYRIDLKSGQKIPLAYPVGDRLSYSPESVTLSSDESLLYFVDEVTGGLYSIRLK